MRKIPLFFALILLFLIVGCSKETQKESKSVNLFDESPAVITTQQPLVKENNVIKKPIERIELGLYKALIDNPRISNAINSNPLVAGKSYRSRLLQKIEELESGNTQRWSDHRHDGPWSEEEQLNAYLHKVTHILYVELHGLVPWSILDYNDGDLTLLLSDLYVRPQFYVSTGAAVFNGNPLVAFDYVGSFYRKFPDKEVKNQKDLLDLIIFGMRSDNWRHFPNQPDDPACEFVSVIKELTWRDYECLKELRLGADGLTSDFLYASLQAYNVPTIQLPQFLHGHTGIRFPTMNLVMKGNDVYNSWKNGFMVYNSLPVNLTYLNAGLYDQWDQFFSCRAASYRSREEILNYLELYDDPPWNQDINGVYCFQAGNYQPGEYLKEQIENSGPSDCQGVDPNADNYYPMPLSDNEVENWLNRISRIAVCE